MEHVYTAFHLAGKNPGRHPMAVAQAEFWNISDLFGCVFRTGNLACPIYHPRFPPGAP
jgi:hypothetical protein